MSEIKLDNQIIYTAATKINQIAEDASQTYFDINTAHDILALDNVLSHDYGKALIADIQSAQNTMNNQKKLIHSLGKIMNSVADELFEAETGSESKRGSIELPVISGIISGVIGTGNTISSLWDDLFNSGKPSHGGVGHSIGENTTQDKTRKSESGSTEATTPVVEDKAMTDSSYTTEIHLGANMDGYSMKQGDYNCFMLNGSNQGCCATSYAIALSVMDGKPHDPTKYWYGNSTHYDEGHVGEYQDANYSDIFSNLMNGNPTMIHYNYTYTDKYGLTHDDGTHWVTVVGIKAGVDINSITADDFIVIDPASGTEKYLSECWKYSQKISEHMKLCA